MLFCLSSVTHSIQSFKLFLQRLAAPKRWVGLSRWDLLECHGSLQGFHVLFFILMLILRIQLFSNTWMPTVLTKWCLKTSEPAVVFVLVSSSTTFSCWKPNRGENVNNMCEWESEWVLFLAGWGAPFGCCLQHSMFSSLPALPRKDYVLSVCSSWFPH